MIRLGIYAPYRRGEATAAACVLADLAASLGASVRWLSPVPVERGVHPAWDGVVRRSRGVASTAHWADGCDAFVWFVPDKVVLDHARVFAPKASHALVPPWHRLDPVRYADCLAYDRCVLPTARARDAFASQVYHARKDAALDVCPWEPGFDPAPRPASPGGPSVYVRVDSSAADDAGPQVLSALRDALARCPDLTLTLARDKSWPKDQYARVKEMLAGWPDRFRVLDRLPLERERVELANHDWAFLPTTRSDFGLDALRALALGVPVVAHDVVPYSALAGLGPGVRLVPCDTVYLGLNVPVAIPLAGAFLRSLECCCGGAGGDPAPVPHAPSLVARRRQFRSYWVRLWGLEDHEG